MLLFVGCYALAAYGRERSGFALGLLLALSAGWCPPCHHSNWPGTHCR
ncbi:hypothetical protein GXW82_15725 [Streptacidiphilus sp. 4-A2]|nr:hypothetical protein [Streptacidiphilus sp. 4-A2]